MIDVVRLPTRPASARASAAATCHSRLRRGARRRHGGLVHRWPQAPRSSTIAIAADRDRAETAVGLLSFIASVSACDASPACSEEAPRIHVQRAKQPAPNRLWHRDAHQHIANARPGAQCREAGVPANIAIAISAACATSTRAIRGERRRPPAGTATRSSFQYRSVVKRSCSMAGPST